MIATKCKEMGVHPEMITEEYIDLITRAAPLHDVGKITISDTILNKPGKLTPEEFEDMKKHALVGGRLIHQFLKGIEDEKYLQIAQDIATYHHEKFNGKGYPYGLSGTDIPLSARIMAVADVFDALVSQRCYKQAMNYNDAFALIDSEAGEHFDPVLVHVFMQIKEDIIENAKQM
jgi:response regulator RpfG family c-di-GMP phosphodiesterase